MSARRVFIHSKDNRFQHAEVLKRNREKRAKYKEFFVEGVRAINGVSKFGWNVRAYLYAPERPLSDWARDVLARSRAAEHWEMPLSLLEELSDKEETSELLAIVAMPPDDVGRIPLAEGMLVVVFDRPGNPGNLGSSLRSCDALQVAGVIMTGHATDLYHPHTIRGSMGSLFSVPVVRLPSHKEVAAYADTLRAKFPELQIVGTSERGEHNIFEHDLRPTSLLVMGNETFGLSANYQTLCTQFLKIPMSGSASSLNVSCATSIFLYERLRQRARSSVNE